MTQHDIADKRSKNGFLLLHSLSKWCSNGAGIPSQISPSFSALKLPRELILPCQQPEALLQAWQVGPSNCSVHSERSNSVDRTKQPSPGHDASKTVSGKLDITLQSFVYVDNTSVRLLSMDGIRQYVVCPLHPIELRCPFLVRFLPNVLFFTLHFCWLSIDCRERLSLYSPRAQPHIWLHPRLHSNHPHLPGRSDCLSNTRAQRNKSSRQLAQVLGKLCRNPLYLMVRTMFSCILYSSTTWSKRTVCGMSNMLK